MKDKLEVGMYCYNKTNRKMGIGKIISFQSNNNINIKYKNDIELVSIGNIKASHNIIELIEEYDVVEFIDGSVLRVESINDKYVCCLSKDNDCAGIFFDKLTLIKNIKSIVTKEQFENMQYKVD